MLETREPSTSEDAFGVICYAERLEGDMILKARIEGVDGEIDLSPNRYWAATHTQVNGSVRWTTQSALRALPQEGTRVVLRYKSGPLLRYSATRWAFA